MQNPLSNLRDIHLPESVDWWPPAIGWWILLISIVIVASVIITITVRHHLKNHYRRDALVELTTLTAKYYQDNDLANYLVACNILLKRVAIHAYGKHIVAKLSGVSWRDFLIQKNNQSTQDDYILIAMTDMIYQQDIAEIQQENIYHCVKNWIKNHK